MLLGNNEQVALDMKNHEKLPRRRKNTYLSYPGEGKHLFFIVPYLLKMMFFKQVLTIRVAMGDVNFKIVPEASVFRGDADFDGPGAQKYHF